MSRVKNICLLTNMLDETHGRQVCKGVFAQCKKYGYSVSVFASLNEFDIFEKEILEGEKIVYKIPDFSRFDGIVVDSVSFLGGIGKRIEDDIYQDIMDSGVPSVCISAPVQGIHTIENSNEEALRVICRHVVEEHKCKKICILTGTKGNSEAENRLLVLVDELEKLGIETPEEYKIYGDFWYVSGEKLADDIVEGRIEKPDAIIAASDHMALGVIQRFTSLGVNVPDDIIVVGFDLTELGMMDKIPVTSIKSNFAECAANAIDYLVGKIDPGKEICPYVADYKSMLHIGKSCGCHYEFRNTMDDITTLIYRTHHNFSQVEKENRVDIGLLMESFIFEHLTGSDTPEKCIENIYETAYIILPFVDFYLCLREDWMENEMNMYHDYPDTMKMVLRRSSNENLDFSSEEEPVVFDSSLMLPQMFDEDARPLVYYYSPIHFGSNGFGYAVLCCELEDNKKFNLVYRNWLRFVDNALEMTRAKQALAELSVRDKMTGLYNRRGMMIIVENMQKQITENKKMFIGVIDMDDLKGINDNYGHNEGDRAIIWLSQAVKAFSRENEICVRAGGDEFYIIGLGDYDDFDVDAESERFNNILKEITSENDKDYRLKASIGFAIGDKGDANSFEAILSQADANMYTCKQKHKLSRKKPANLSQNRGSSDSVGINARTKQG
ncbi:MAG: GGDEF domain-containing protein [Eubacterium sp.]|nr:GGDEF domain-containing protein [Eubacterium sp.]